MTPTPTLTPSHTCGQPARLAKPPQMAKSIGSNRPHCLFEGPLHQKRLLFTILLLLESRRITLILNTNLGWAFGESVGFL